MNTGMDANAVNLRRWLLLPLFAAAVGGGIFWLRDQGHGVLASALVGIAISWAWGWGRSIGRAEMDRAHARGERS